MSDSPSVSASLRPRRCWSPKEKLEIVLEGIASGAVSEVCRRRGVSVSVYYEWRDRLLGSAEQVFRPSRPTGGRDEVAVLLERLQQKDGVIAELAQENLVLKRGR